MGSRHGSQLKVSVAPGMCRGEQRTEANQEAGGVGWGGGAGVRHFLEEKREQIPDKVKDSST